MGLCWFFSLGWNPVIQPGKCKCFSPLGFNITWSDEDASWMVHIFLLPLLIEFGRVSPIQSLP